MMSHDRLLFQAQRTAESREASRQGVSWVYTYEQCFFASSNKLKHFSYRYIYFSSGLGQDWNISLHIISSEFSSTQDWNNIISGNKTMVIQIKPWLYKGAPSMCRVPSNMFVHVNSYRQNMISFGWSTTKVIQSKSIMQVQNT